MFITGSHSPGKLCSKISTEEYHKLLFLLEDQYQSLPLPLGSNNKVLLPSAPAICALVLLTVMIKSQASIRELFLQYH